MTPKSNRGPSGASPMSSPSLSEDVVPVMRRTTSNNRANRASTIGNRQSKRYSVAALYMSMGGVDRDDDLDDELAKAQKHLRELKAWISEQSKSNFLLEKDVRYLDGRIALLIQNKMAPEEQREVASRLSEEQVVTTEEYFPDRKKTESYGTLFFLLQSEPKHIALLCRQVSMPEIDSLLQSVMFTIYGNQYEQREEHLLLTMFQEVLAYQFDITTEFSSLLRANTPVSRMMTTYTRRGPGQSYLRTALSERLNAILDAKDNLEINPLKVYEELEESLGAFDSGISNSRFASPPTISFDEASRHPRVLELIRPRYERLKEITSELLDTIVASLEQVPYGIRWICKQIRILTKRKHPTASEAAMASLIGAFFFLRFINPAIVTPQAYMLVDKLPANKSRRTLTLIAKILQNLANKPSYAKEPYMSSLASFIESNKSRINKFFHQLCEVPDFNESLEMDQCIALSRMDLKLKLTLNEIYGMHSLLSKYRSGVCDSPQAHLSILLDELGPAPGLVPRNANATIELSLISRWETVIGDSETPLELLRADVMFMEAKSLLINIIRAFPPGTSVLRRPFDLRKIADHAATTDEQALVKRGIKALDLLNEIEASDSDDFELLQTEVEYELKQLGSLKESVEKEAKSLEDVYGVIRGHNDYLKQQLDTYKSYLANVRKQTTKPKMKQRITVRKYNVGQLTRDGVISAWQIPDSRTNSITMYIASPVAGTYVLSLVYKGRSDPLVTMDMKFDDLLELCEAREQGSIDMKFMMIAIRPLIQLLKRDIDK